MLSVLSDIVIGSLRTRWIASLLAALFLLTSCEPPGQSNLTIAVASNFMPTAKKLVNTFTAETGTEVILVSGSTGKLAAQIQQGAPFRLFLSADSAAPRHLAKLGMAVSETRFTYARGRLALHGIKSELILEKEGFPSLDHVMHLAIANPELAPYGRAAKETLLSLGLWESLQGRIVRGENIAQTWHFVTSGNAELGFVAVSQLSENETGSTWLVPDELHTPIEQDAILIHDSPEARQFLTFLRREPARQMIKADGYDLPPLSHAE